MRLEKLIENLKIKQVLGNIDIEVLSVKTDSNTVTSGSLFICLNGKGFDGHSFIRQVESYGAVAVLTERRVETALTQIIVEDTRVAMSIIAAEFYEHADKKLRLVGVTGTNGKTTTAHLIRSVLNKAGIPCGVIGTLGTFYADKCLEPTLTTPDPLVLHKTFSDMLNSGIKAVVMEVSAHAVHFEKVKNFRHCLHRYILRSIFDAASEGILNAPRGEREISVTRGPSGIAERLNCCVKNLLVNISRYFFIYSSLYSVNTFLESLSISFGALPYLTVW